VTDTSFRWWDFRSLSETNYIDVGVPIKSMELSVQQSTLIVCAGKSVSFIPFSLGAAPTHTVTLPYTTSSASLHPTLRDRFVVGSTDDEWVHPHGLDGGEREVHKGHHGPVHCVEYSPDGEMFASGSGEFVNFKFNISQKTSLLLMHLPKRRGWHDSPLADVPWEVLWLVARET